MNWFSYVLKTYKLVPALSEDKPPGSHTVENLPATENYNNWVTYTEKQKTQDIQLVNQENINI